MGSNLGTRPEPHYVRHLKGWPLEDLFDAGAAVEHLRRHPGWDPLMRLIAAEVAEIDRSLGAGPLDSQADYAFAHGRRSALLVAAEGADAIVRYAALKLDEQRSKHERDAESSREG